MSSTSVHVRITAANDITLSARGFKVKGLQNADLTWTPAGSGTVAVYRNGQLLTTTPHDGTYTDSLNRKGGGTYTYRVCTSTPTPVCSNEAQLVF
jgi:thermitase